MAEAGWRDQYALPTILQHMPHVLVHPVHSDLTIKKSRFIGCVELCTGRAAAIARVTALRAEHPGATHVCWALMAGGQSAANDDGEPSGSAGRPMLEVLRHHDLEGVLATVVRHYGGIQLGAGGLARAYTDAVAQSLLKAEKMPIVRHTALRCVVPYALEGWLRRELPSHAAQLQAVQHGQGVEVALTVPEASAAALVARINDAGQGLVNWVDNDAGAPSA